MKTSYHTHTKRCKHGKGNVNDFVNFAIAKKFEVIGFTDHIPFKDNRMDFCRMFYSELDEYISEINEAKKANPDITIYSGFEAEYFEDSLDYYKELLTKVDYLVLGQHAIKKDDKYIFIDNCQSEEEFNMYVDAIEKAASTGYFSMINHPDLFGLAKDEWDDVCIKLTHRIAKIAIKYNLPLELNAQGIRRWTKTASRPYAYPIDDFWKIISKEYPNIPILISSDAHSPEALTDSAVERCKELAKKYKLNIRKNLFTPLK